MTDDELRDQGYWICDTCSVKKGLTTKYPKGGNTISLGECDWCKKSDEWVTPIMDFKESGDKTWD
jgi:hypothetical protein